MRFASNRGLLDIRTVCVFANMRTPTRIIVRHCHALMNNSLAVIFAVIVASPFIGHGQEEMTLTRFREIVSSPGDNAPLSPKMAAAGPLWTNATVSFSLKFEGGKTFQATAAETSKTVRGKYVVTTVNAPSFKQPAETITTYDEAVSVHKVWAVQGETIIEGRIVYDVDKKLYAVSSAYGAGVTELGVGSFSTTESTSRTWMFTNGVLFCTRESRTTPVIKSK